MSRLSIVLSTLALILAAIALATPYVQDEGTVPGREAIAEVVREVAAADPAAEVNPAESTEVAAAENAQVVPAPDPETIGPAVRQYLLDNPGVLEEVVAALEAQREETQAGAQREAVAANRDDLLAPEFSPAVGNAEGNVTLVEFFDYNCGFCKRMLPQIVDLIEKDDNLRVVFREWPVLGEDSQDAARVALAVRQVAPEKYFEFHRTLLSHKGRVGKAEAMEVAEGLGIDTAAVEARTATEETTAALQENFRLGDALGLRGTPSYVVGDKVFMGAVPQEELESQIAQVRESGCTDC